MLNKENKTYGPITTQQNELVKVSGRKILNNNKIFVCERSSSHIVFQDNLLADEYKINNNTALVKVSSIDAKAKTEQLSIDDFGGLRKFDQVQTKFKEF